MNFTYPITGLLLLGETLLIFIGEYWLQKGEGSWNTLKNRRYLIADGSSGVVLVLNYFLIQEFWYAIVVSVFIVVSIFTHYFRLTEFLLKREHAFCKTRAMYYLNNLLLVFLFGLLFIVFTN